MHVSVAALVGQVRRTSGPSEGVGEVMGAIGIGLLLIAAVIALVKRARVAKFTHTTGTVTGHHIRKRRRKSRTVHMAHPAVQFFDEQGKALEFVSDLGSSSRTTHPIGTELPVVYDPTRPGVAYIDSPMELHYTSFVIAVLGTILTITGLMMAFVLAG